jgi:predicted nucleic acid-binding protein
VILFDTSVIIDVRDTDSAFHGWAKKQIREAVAGEGAAVNPIVLAEASVRAKDPRAIPGILESFGMTLVSLPSSVAVPAAKTYSVYLDRLAKERKPSSSRIPLPDFLIGAHAEAEGLTLVTRDPDRVRTYFPNVDLVTP